jgi:uncharacterized membrane protein
LRFSERLMGVAAIDWHMSGDHGKVGITQSDPSRSSDIDVLRGLSVVAVILLHINIRIPFAHSSIGALLPHSASSVP